MADHRPPPPPSARPAAAPGPRRPGEQSAGACCVTMVVALALAALVNADALVERAERKPFGDGRDRSLAIWHPVQDIAHLTQISRLRDLGDWLGGQRGRGRPRSCPGGAAGPTTTVPPSS